MSHHRLNSDDLGGPIVIKIDSNCHRTIIVSLNGFNNWLNHDLVCTYTTLFIQSLPIVVGNICGY